LARLSRKLALVAIDILLISGAYFGAYWLRLGWGVSVQHLPVILGSLPVILAISLPIHLKFGLFNAVLKYASIDTLLAVFRAVGLSLALSCLVLFSLYRMEGVPRGTFIIYGMILLLSVGGTRMAFRVGRHRWQGSTLSEDAPKVLLFGAEDNAEIVIRSIRSSVPTPFDLVGLIDGDPAKRKHEIHGLTILGGLETLHTAVQQLGVNELWITLPDLAGEELRRIYETARGLSIRVKLLPRLTHAWGGVQAGGFRDLDISHLIRRAPRKLDREGMRSWIQNRRVLITGAGGSIGSELSRQVVELGPSSVALCDAGEENLFEIHTELVPRHESVLKRPFLVDVRNAAEVEAMFRQTLPDVVIHAAAFKHVPIVEVNPCEGVLTNVQGLLEVARTSERHGVEDFLFISTDKAIRPANVMGATKRLGEEIIRHLNANGNTKFSAVRFGNVLGSSGSVVPIFQEQIRTGRSITVTHPDMTRYFMLVSEAVELILQAGSLGRGGEIYVLDMGHPVKIVDLAMDLASLMGKQVGRDIRIEFTGIRPGEKMHEEPPITPKDEQTEYPDIWIERCLDRFIRDASFMSRVKELIDVAKMGNASEVLQLLKLLLPEYRPSDLHSVAAAAPKMQSTFIP
jgi:FlaA1/EpsC-like NDP-sugar epimerase